MITMLVDAFVLLVLLNALDENEVDFVTALVISVLASIGTGIITMMLAVLLGVGGIILAGIVGVIATGAAVSWVLGMDLKRAMLVSVIFFAVHVGLTILLSLMS